ncbi:MAG: tricarballylate utilization 4Fe-4S protein TcuB [Acidimicrobiia bacterium]|nr:tricarballylate utilization 4Fe-4S protein TcuB [Acidimicrobiia bacterium]
MSAESSETWTARQPVSGPGVLDHATASLAEADRLMTICNACRYCEGLCAVFPAMERRRVFTDGDLDFLANLCHNCGACLYDCQYAPPHEFAVTVPANLAELRAETWARYAWPAQLAAAFARNALVTTLAIVVAVAAFVTAIGVSMGSSFLEVHTGPGAFYDVVPHAVIVLVFIAALGYGLAALSISLRRYWRAIGGGALRWRDLAGAGRSASTLEYLDGGGVGCMNTDERPTDTRRRYHHLTYYGFALCLASTTLAAVLDTGFGSEAPYAWYHPVVVLGAAGGFGLIVGPIGLLAAKHNRDPDLSDAASRPMELSFLVLLLLLAVTGFGVLVLRATAAMPLLLAVHLGVVFAFFVTIPYGKFVHGFYRYLALVRDRQERTAT